MKLSAEIKSAMVKKGLEQVDVADFFEITQQAVSQWMVKEDVPIKHRKKLSGLLGIDIEKIIDNNSSSTTTQTTTGNRSPAQQHTGSGNQAMYDRDGITCTGLDERHPPSPQIDTDEWAELLYWIRRHPTLVPGLVKIAREKGMSMDDTARG